MVEKLKKQFENYDGSSYFIECVFDTFDKSGQKEKRAQWFIINHFKQYKDCDYAMMRKCAAHWNNVAFDKLNQHDFINYKQSIASMSNYRIVSKIME